MNISPNGLALIKKFESFSPIKYICPAGRPTIGFGHVITDDNLPQFITEGQATELLKKDVEIAEKAIVNLITRECKQYEFDALVSFVFNVGEGNFKSSSLMGKVNSKDNSAAGEFGRWVMANGKPLPGLIKRRAAEALMFINKE